MEDILRRLGSVETCVVDLKTQVASIAANMPHLATAKSVSDLRTEMSDLRTEMSDLRTEMNQNMAELRLELTASDSANKSEVVESISNVDSKLSAAIAGVDLKFTEANSEIKSELSRIAAIIPHLATAASLAAAETRIIKWFVATAFTLTTLAFSIAKFVH